MWVYFADTDLPLRFCIGGISDIQSHRAFPIQILSGRSMRALYTLMVSLFLQYHHHRRPAYYYILNQMSRIHSVIFGHFPFSIFVFVRAMPNRSEARVLYIVYVWHVYCGFYLSYLKQIVYCTLSYEVWVYVETYGNTWRTFELGR